MNIAATEPADQTAHVPWEIYGGTLGIILLLGLIVWAINTPLNKTRRSR
jgi:hypothetical protein